MGQKKKTDSDPAPVSDIIIFACDKGDYACKKRDVKEGEHKHAAGFWQPTGQGKNPPLMVEHCVHLVGDQCPQTKVKDDFFKHCNGNLYSYL